MTYPQDVGLGQKVEQVKQNVPQVNYNNKMLSIT